jgi:hypothetical protein
MTDAEANPRLGGQTMAIDDYHETCRDEARQELYLERRFDAWRSLRGVVDKGNHDGKCEDCGAELDDENTFELSRGWICEKCWREDGEPIERLKHTHERSTHARRSNLV